MDSIIVATKITISYAEIVERETIIFNLKNISFAYSTRDNASNGGKHLTLNYSVVRIDGYNVYLEERLEDIFPPEWVDKFVAHKVLKKLTK